MNLTEEKTGLSKYTIEKLQKIFSKYENVKQVVLYGSRAKGSFRNGSDVDLCFFGKDLDLKTLFKIEEEIENLTTPYSFDNSIHHTINHPNLLEHIERVGIVFYTFELT